MTIQIVRSTKEIIRKYYSKILLSKQICDFDNRGPIKFSLSICKYIHISLKYILCLIYRESVQLDV